MGALVNPAPSPPPFPAVVTALTIDCSNISVPLPHTSPIIESNIAGSQPADNESTMQGSFASHHTTITIVRERDANAATILTVEVTGGTKEFNNHIIREL